MIICKNCLQALESHEGNQAKKKVDNTDSVEIMQGYYNDDGDFIVDDNSMEEYIFCEWCEQYELADEMYII